MNKNTSASATFAKQKTLTIVILAIVVALLMVAGLLVSTINTSANAAAVSIASWWAEADDATLVSGNGDPLATITSKKDGDIQASFALTGNYAPTSDNKYLAIKYSGTMLLKNVLLWGTGPNDVNIPGWSTGGVADKDWLVPVKTIGTDYSVVVIDLGGGCGAFGVDTVTNLGFLVTGSEGNTFVIHEMEFLSSTDHNFGTPTPPVEEPAELTIGELELGAADNGFTIAKAGDDTNITFDTQCGYNFVKSSVRHYSSDYKYLYLRFTLSHDMKIGVYADGAPLQDHAMTNKDTHEISIPLSDKTLESSFDLKLYFDAPETWGVAYDAPRTVTIHEISFKEDDPMASTDLNSFRTPVGYADIVYSASDNTISYTNNANEYWRYVEILLDNHTPVTHDVLSIKLTGYNGLVMGVRVLYNDEVEGETTAATKDVIASSAYYSEIKTDELIEIVIYLQADGLKGKEVTGVQLYLDAPANAGKDGEVEITLNSIEMLSSAELNPADVTITASDATITYGETPSFNEALKSGENDVNGVVVMEHRSYGATGLYQAGLPTDAGEYEVRFYYMGSREYNYSRATTAKLTINKADSVTADDGIAYNETTRVVTVKDGYEASTSENFAEGSAITDGYVIPYGETKTIYYRHVGDANHNVGEVKNKTYTAPAAPAKTVTSIAVTTQPTKTTYTVGDTISLTGLVVTATYSDETTAPVTVTTAMLSGYDMSTAGTKTVTITHEGKTATFSITVNAAQGGGDTKPEPAKDGLSTTAIVLIVLAAVVCVGGAAAAVVIVLKKKNGAQK